MSNITVNQVFSSLDLSNPRIAEIDEKIDEKNIEICTKIIYRCCSQTRKEINRNNFVDICPSYVVQSLIYYIEISFGRDMWQCQHDLEEIMFVTYSFCKELFKQILVGECRVVDIEMQFYAQKLLDQLKEDNQTDTSYMASKNADQKFKIAQELLAELLDK